METLRRLWSTKPNDHFVSFDLKDSFYALSIHSKNREAFTVNLDGPLLQLCALTMGWSMCPYTFQKFTKVFVNKLRDPEATARPGRLPNLSAKTKKKWLRRRRLCTGAWLLPFVDEFAVFANDFDKTMYVPQERDFRPREQSRPQHTSYQGLPHSHPSRARTLAWKWTSRRASSGPPYRNSETSPCSPRFYCVL